MDWHSYTLPSTYTLDKGIHNMDESHTDRPETLVTCCFLRSLGERLSTKDTFKVLTRTKELLSFYKNMFTQRNYNIIEKLVEGFLLSILEDEASDVQERVLKDS